MVMPSFYWGHAPTAAALPRANLPRSSVAEDETSESDLSDTDPELEGDVPLVPPRDDLDDSMKKKIHRGVPNPE
eukprot:gene2356-3176_t